MGLQNNQIDNKKKIILWFVLILSIFISYLPTFNNSFCYDDNDLILKNHFVTEQNWKEIWKNDLWKSSRGESAYYRPLIPTCFSLEYLIYKDNAWGYHLSNLLFHILSVILVFKISKFVFKNRKGNFYFSYIASFIFALHPVNSQTVYWIAARGDLFITIAILSGIFFITKNNKFQIPGLLISSFLAIFSKETGFLYFVLVPLFYYFFCDKEINFKDKSKKILSISLIFLPTLFLYIYLRKQAITVSPFIQTDESFWQQSDGNISRFLTIPITWSYYLFKSIFPYFLNFETDIHLFYSFSDLQFVLSALITIVSIFLLVIFRKNKFVLWLFLFYFISLFPVLNFIPAFESGMEHYLYLPLTCFSIVLTYFLFKKLKLRIILFSLILISFSITIFLRGKVWKNNISLWEDASSKTSIYCRQGWTRSKTNLAHAYFNYGLLNDSFKYIYKAESLYTLIREKYPDYTGIYIGLGDISFYYEDYEKAEKYYKKVLDKYGSNYFIYNKLGVSLAYQEKYYEAKENFQKAIYLKNDYSEALIHLSNMYLIDSNIIAAKEIFQSITNIKPSIEYNYKTLEIALSYFDNSQLVGSYDEMIGASDILFNAMLFKQQNILLQRIYKEFPEDSNVLYELTINSLIKINNIEAGMLFLEEGLVKFPNDTRFLREKAVFFINIGDSLNAVMLFEKILTLSSDHPEKERMINFIEMYYSNKDNFKIINEHR